MVTLDDGVLPDLVGRIGLPRRIGEHHRWMHIEKLNQCDGERGLTRPQGED